jgi:SAM-dependent methyltransferase
MTDHLMERFYPESRFGGFTDIDGTVAFYPRVNALAASKDVVLDFGCGQGIRLRPGHANDPVPIRLGSGAPNASHAFLCPAIERGLSVLPEGARVLDIGCGNGSLTAAWAKGEWDVTSVDLSESGIAQAKASHPNIAFHKMPAGPELVEHFGEGCFDAIRFGGGRGTSVCSKRLGATKQLSLSAEQKPMVQQWLRNYRKLKDTLERICELNQQLLRPEKKA